MFAGMRGKVEQVSNSAEAGEYLQCVRAGAISKPRESAHRRDLGAEPTRPSVEKRRLRRVQGGGR